MERKKKGGGGGPTLIHVYLYGAKIGESVNVLLSAFYISNVADKSGFIF